MSGSNVVVPDRPEVEAAVAELRGTAGLADLPALDDAALQAIWRQVLRAWQAPATAESVSDHPARHTGQGWTLPLNLTGHAVLARVRPGESVTCEAVEIVGQGSFVRGEDNAVFGEWDSLLAIDRCGRAMGLIPGHGGEIIPGRLADHVDRLREYVRTGVRRPVQLDLDPTMACPSACTFCFSADYRASRRTGLHLRGDLLVELIHGWADRGVRVVRFDGGGDPLAHPRLFEAIAAASRRGLRTAVLTAADLLREPHLEPLLAAQTYLRVSLNAGDNPTRLAVHRPLNQRLRLTEPLRLVRRLADRRAERYGDAGSSVMPLGATSMLVPANAHSAYDTARMARQAGFDHLSFRVVLGAGHAVTFDSAAREELAEQLARARAELTDGTFRIFTPTRPLTDQGYRPSAYFDTCLASTHRVLVEVGPDPGTAAIVPCGRYRGHGFRWSAKRPELTVFGLIDSAAEIDRVWNGPAMTSLVSRFPTACGDCIDRSANLMFNAMVEALRRDDQARFLRFRATDGMG